MASYPVSGNEFIFEGDTLTVLNTASRSTDTFTIGGGLRLEVRGSLLTIDNSDSLDGFILHRRLRLNPAIALTKLMQAGSTDTYIVREDDLEFVGTEDLDYVVSQPGSVAFFQRAHYRYTLRSFPLVLRMNGPVFEIYRMNLTNETNFQQYCETRRKNITKNSGGKGSRDKEE